MAPDTDDLDAALDGLAAQETDSQAETAPSIAPDAAPGPPALPRRSLESTRRVAFDDLFTADSAPSSVRGSPEEKITYFRERLKSAEAQMARVREAWQVREREMDDADAEAARERKRAEDSLEKQAKLQDFFNKKKVEFEEYAQKVAAAFAEKEADEKKLEVELEGARAQLAATANGEEVADIRAELASMVDLRGALERDISIRDEGLVKLKKLVEEQRQSIEERDEQIERLSSDLETFDKALQQSNGNLRELESKLEDETNELNAEVELERQSFGEIQDRLHRDLEARDAAIAKLEASLEEQRRAVEQRDRALEVRDHAIAKLEESVAAVKAALADRDAEIVRLSAGPQIDPAMVEELAALNGTIAARDAEIARLSARSTADPAQGKELASLRGTVESLRAELDSARQGGEGPPRDEANVVRLNKALALAERMLGDIEACNPAIFDGREATGEMLTKLGKAIAIAARAASMV